MKTAFMILAIFWMVLSVLVFIGIMQLPTFCTACACLIAGLGFLYLYCED